MMVGPHNPLQERLKAGLTTRLASAGCLFVDPPDTPTALGPVAHVGIAFTESYTGEVSPLEFLTRLPKPRGMGMVIATVDRIPEGDLFDIGRGLIVRKAAHIGLLVEGDEQTGTLKRALWISMAGNHKLLTGNPEEILDSAALRILVHVGSENLTGHAGDESPHLTWEAWCASPIHHEMAEAARALGDAGLIEDRVPLEKYATGRQIRHVLSFLNRSALGEGMRSQLDPHLRVMGVTTTGGGKINLSADPNDGQIVPVGSLTWSGYVRAVPENCPVTFNAPSVETHENGMVYVAGWLVNAGLVDSFDSFMAFLADHFDRHETIAILPEGAEPNVTAIEHFHRQPVRGSVRQPDRVEIVHPDHDRFPLIDFPCGVREAELHLVSALFRAESFRTPGGLRERIVIAELPGHGIVAVTSGPRREMTDRLIHGMEMQDVTRV
jgi:hypothetical protein